MLSDRAIRQYIGQGLLVPGGDQAKATQAAYHFTAGKIFTGGPTCLEVDWTGAGLSSHYTISPGAMVWVRMRDAVALPHDICAVWWQTYSLSRKGIMLINMSIVDPGYNGFLTCLLVNFGNQHVPIDPSTTIAKLAFFKTDQPVSEPFAASKVTNYDTDLLQIATNGPSSFLQIDNINTELGAQKERILQEIAEDAPKKLRATAAWASLAFLALVAATTAIPWVQSLVKPNLEDAIQDAIDKRIAGQLSMLPTEREKALTLRVEKLEKELAAASRNNMRQADKGTKGAS